MKTMFQSKRLWNLVEKGYTEEGKNKEEIKELKQQDVDALYLIQQGLDERILIRITKAETAKQAWGILNTEYQGNTKILSVKLYSLRQELETTKMKESEKIQDFISRVLDVGYQIRMLGEEVTQAAIVGKILRSLTPRFNHVVSSIVEAKDLSTLTVEKLSGSLKGHEAILFLSAGREEQTALQALTNSFARTSLRGG